MRLSEAIAIGRTLIKAVPMVRLSDDGQRGCALGMADAAYGKAAWAANDIHQWVAQSECPRLPCGCELNSYWLIYTNTIAHVFNQHVCGDGTWTLDQLIDYVRSVEPAEPAEPAIPQPAEQHAEILR